jgi:hypothetical protein
VHVLVNCAIIFINMQGVNNIKYILTCLIKIIMCLLTTVLIHEKRKLVLQTWYEYSFVVLTFLYRNRRIFSAEENYSNLVV